MAKKIDDKGNIYWHEVCKISIQDEKGCLNLTNSNKERRIGKNNDKNFDTDTEGGDIFKKHTEKVIIYKKKSHTSLKGEKDDYTCEVCAVECSGIENFKLHIDGKKHNKNLKKLNILKEMKPRSGITQITTDIKIKQKGTNWEEYIQPRNKEARLDTLKYLKLEDLAIPEEDVCSPNLSINYCGACKKYFASQRACHQHLLSEHLEKDKIKKQLMKNISIKSEDSVNFSYEICRKVFTGIVPYKQHLSSSSHIKREDSINELQKIRNVPLSSEMYCVECDKKFIDIVPFNDHIKGSLHLRMMKKQYLLAKLKKEHSEVSKNTMSGIYGDDVKEKKVFDCVMISKTKNTRSNCHDESPRELQKNDYDAKKLNELLKKDFQEECLIQFSDSDGNLDEDLLQL